MKEKKIPVERKRKSSIHLKGDAQCQDAWGGGGEGSEIRAGEGKCYE